MCKLLCSATFFLNQSCFVCKGCAVITKHIKTSCSEGLKSNSLSALSWDHMARERERH